MFFILFIVLNFNSVNVIIIPHRIYDAFKTREGPTIFVQYYGSVLGIKIITARLDLCYQSNCNIKSFLIKSSGPFHIRLIPDVFECFGINLGSHHEAYCLSTWQIHAFSKTISGNLPQHIIVITKFFNVAIMQAIRRDIDPFKAWQLFYFSHRSSINIYTRLKLSYKPKSHIKTGLIKRTTSSFICYLPYLLEDLSAQARLHKEPRSFLPWYTFYLRHASLFPSQFPYTIIVGTDIAIHTETCYCVLCRRSVKLTLCRLCCFHVIH